MIKTNANFNFTIKANPNMGYSFVIQAANREEALAFLRADLASCIYQINEELKVIPLIKQNERTT